jgi:LuxR family transcriptional regulator, quorum-sensing system regulator SolR
VLFADTPELWRDSQDSGIRHRWSQSSFNANGVAGMLSLSRSGDPITRNELSDKEPRMRWLVALTHLSISRLHPHSPPASE